MEVGGAEEMADTLATTYLCPPPLLLLLLHSRHNLSNGNSAKFGAWAELWAGADNRQQTTKVQPSHGAGPWTISRHRAHWIIQRVAVTQSVPLAVAGHTVHPNYARHADSGKLW